MIPLIFGICWSVSIQKTERIKQSGGGGSAGVEVAVGYILIRQPDKYFKMTTQSGNILTTVLVQVTAS